MVITSMKRKFEFETNLPLKVAKQHAYLELAKMREYKYELKNSLNIQPGESALATLWILKQKFDIGVIPKCR